MMTIHVRREDPVTLPQVVRHLHALAGGDRTRSRVTSRGVEVDDALAAAYLAQPPGAPPPAAAPVPPNLADVVRGVETSNGLAGDGSKPTPRRKSSRGVQP